MPWYSNEAATREVRRLIGSYAKAQGGYALSLIAFSGMSPEEWVRWVDAGEVSDRYVRMWFHGYELRYPGDEVELWHREPREERMSRVLRYADWRAAMVNAVRVSWPGAADRIQAYIETQVRP